jgi:hypothetical protein
MLSLIILFEFVICVEINELKLLKNEKKEIEIKISSDSDTIGSTYKNVNSSMIIILEEGNYVEENTINILYDLKIEGVNKLNCNITYQNLSSLNIFNINTSSITFHLENLSLLFCWSHFYFIIFGNSSQYCSLILTNCFLTSNISLIRGQVFFFEESYISNYTNEFIMKGCDVTNISCESEALIYLRYHENCTIIYNSSFYLVNVNGFKGNGGCFYLKFWKLFNSSYCSVRSCSSGDYGSFVYFSASSFMILKNMVFMDCGSGDYGGAVDFYSDSSALNVEAFIENCVFIGCYVNKCGAGLILENYNTGSCINCSFENCSQINASADSGGGGLMVGFGVETTLWGLTFKTCIADVGIYVIIDVLLIFFI